MIANKSQLIQKVKMPWAIFDLTVGHYGHMISVSHFGHIMKFMGCFGRSSFGSWAVLVQTLMQGAYSHRHCLMTFNSTQLLFLADCDIVYDE